MNATTNRGRVPVLLVTFVAIAALLCLPMIGPSNGKRPHSNAERRIASAAPKSLTLAVYHENLAGVGRLDDYVIPAHLKPLFAGLEGRYVEVVTPNLGWTEWALGPIVLQHIDAVRPLPSPPIEIDINVRRTVADELSVDVFLSLKNTSNEPVTVDANYVQLGFLSDRTDLSNADLEGGWSFISEGTGYTAKQILYGGSPSFAFEGFYGAPFTDYFEGVRRDIVGAPGYRSRSEPVSRFRLLPNESVPFWWRESQARPGRHEVAVRYSHYVPEARSYIPIRAWKLIDVPLPREKTVPEPLKIRATVTTEVAAGFPSVDGAWTRLHKVDGRLINESGRERHIFAQGYSAEYMENYGADEVNSWGLCLPGEIVLYGENGELVKGLVDWSTSSEAYDLRTIDSEGIHFHFWVWERNPLRSSRVAWIEFATITDAGPEKIMIANDIPFWELPNPEWGPAVEGIRCRILPKQERYSTHGEIRLGFEIDSERQRMDVIHPHVELVIDGESIPLFDAKDWTFPRRFSVSVPEQMTITPGRHKFQVKIHGEPGAYTSRDGHYFRTFEGTLISNELDLEVGE